MRDLARGIARDQRGAAFAPCGKCSCRAGILKKERQGQRRVCSLECERLREAMTMGGAWELSLAAPPPKPTPPEEARPRQDTGASQREEAERVGLTDCSAWSRNCIRGRHGNAEPRILVGRLGRARPRSHSCCRVARAMPPPTMRRTTTWPTIRTRPPAHARPRDDRASLQGVPGALQPARRHAKRPGFRARSVDVACERSQCARRRCDLPHRRATSRARSSPSSAEPTPGVAPSTTQIWGRVARPQRETTWSNAGCRPNACI